MGAPYERVVALLCACIALIAVWSSSQVCHCTCPAFKTAAGAATGSDLDIMRVEGSSSGASGASGSGVGLSSISSRLSSLIVPAAAPNYEPRGLYIGNGIVFCFVAPLSMPMWLEGSDKGMTPHLCRGMGWEPDTSAVFQRLIKPGGHVLDVGSNVGYFTLLFARLVGTSGRVLAVEASPRTFDLVKTTIEFNGLTPIVQVVNKAAFEKDDETVHISVSQHRPLNNRISLTGTTGGDTLPVKTTTIDTLTRTWQQLDLIKIDVEGAEAFAFNGARQTLARFPSVILIMEVNVDRMGAAKAASFYQAINALFPVMRHIGDAGRIVPVSQKELMDAHGRDELLVLTRAPERLQ